MRRIRAAFLRVLNVLRRDRLEREMADELQAHLQLHTDDKIRAGMTREDARRDAVLALGGIEQARERCRDRRGLPWLETFLGDIRYGIRALGKSPAFTLGAVSALTIGVGANVVVFSVADALILRPLPVVEPERLVRGYTDGDSNTPYTQYLGYRDRTQMLSSLAAFQGVSLVLRGEGPAEQVSGVAVSGNYFATLGVRAVHGRVIGEHDDRPGSPGVIVVSDAFWRRYFGADPAVVGRVISVNGHPYTIVGVAPRTFTGTQSPVRVDVWVPWNAPTLAPSPDQLATGGGRSAHLIGRLRPDVTLAQAQAEMTTLASSAMSRSSTQRSRAVILSPARTLLPQMANLAGTFVGLLSAMAGLLLVVACVNIAGLLVARSEARRREFAVRVALGAGRSRLVRQLLTESVLLSSIGGVLGVLLAIAVGRILSSVSLPVAEPIALDLGFDSRLALFAFALTLLATILFGLAPAAQFSKGDVSAGLRDGAFATAGRHRRWIRGVLVTTQITFATLLLIGAGMLARSVISARAMDVGFSADRILVASLDLSTLSYSRERGHELYERLLGRLNDDSRVVTASFVGTVPLTVSSQALGFVKDGDAAPEPNRRVDPVFFDSISPGYFRTVGIPLLLGRDFTAADDVGAPDVAIVNETLATRFWPGENPIGKRLRSLGPGNSLGSPIEIVGLVRNAKYATVGEDRKMFLYFPFGQHYTSRVALLVKTPGDPMGAVPVVRTALATLDPDVAISRLGTLEEATRVSLLPVRVAATLAGLLGVVALVLATIGISAMTTYLLRQRTREVGIRLALGAAPSEVIRALTREGLRWAAAGVALGVLASVAGTHLLRNLLYGVSPLILWRLLSSPDVFL